VRFKVLTKVIID